MSDFLTNIGLPVISFLIVLGPLIFLHELGHFIALRLTGVTVLEFGIGFPPRAVKLFEQNGTIFSLNWLPIGGFVRPLGEDFVRPVGEAATEQERAAFEKHQAELEALGKKVTRTKSLLETTPWQRIFFFIAGIVMNMITAFVLFMLVALLGQPGPAIVVVNVSPKSPAEQAGIKLKDVVLTVNGHAVTNAEQLKAVPDKADKSVDLTILRDGQVLTMNLPPATSTLKQSGVLISTVTAGTPAEVAGLQVGDLILKVDKTSVGTNDSLLSYINSHTEQSVTIQIERNDQELSFSLVPRKNPPAGQGPMGIEIEEVTLDRSTGLLLTPADAGQLVRKDLFGSIADGFQQTVTWTQTVFGAPINLIAGKIRAQDARPGSVVAISQIGGNILQQSLNVKEPYPILRFAAIISISLAFVNLLPIPGLDGGRILFVLIELIRGKPMDPEREGLVHMVGLMALLALSAILIVNDIINPITSQLPK